MAKPEPGPGPVLNSGPHTDPAFKTAVITIICKIVCVYLYMHGAVMILIYLVLCLGSITMYFRLLHTTPNVSMS